MKDFGNLKIGSFSHLFASLPEPFFQIRHIKLFDLAFVTAKRGELKVEGFGNVDM